MERLGWVLVLFLLIGTCHQLVRAVQRYTLKSRSVLLGKGEETLIVVVSSHCAICPAQKNVVTRLSQRYPSLRVVTLDAERHTAQVRELSVMTVPTTLLQAADGTLRKINNGFIALEPLAAQIDKLVQP